MPDMLLGFVPASVALVVLLGGAVALVRPRALRPRALVASALVLSLAVVAVPAARSAGQAAPADPRQEDPLAGDSPAGRELRAATERGAQAAARWRAEHQTPAAKAEREASRRRFAGLEQRDAVAVLREHFGHSVAAPPRQPLHGRDVVELVSPWLARVREGGSEQGTAMLSALAPLAAPDAQGDLAPLDLELVDAGGHLRPRRSAGRVRLPERLGRGVEVGDAIVLRPRGGSAGEAPVVVGGSAVYVNSATDTDTVARPIPEGVEMSEVLRSEASPERFELDVDGREGLDVRRAPDARDGFEVFDGERQIASIGEPFAYDADGRVVPVTTSLAGRSLAMEIAHRGRDLRYPIELDPTVTDRWDWEGMTWGEAWETGGIYEDRAGWRFHADYIERHSHWPGDGWLGRGWHIDYDAGSQWFDWNKYAYMRYYPPGDTRISSAYIESSFAAGAKNGGCLFGGIQGYRPSDGLADWEDRADWCGDGRPDVCCGDEHLDVRHTYYATKGYLWPTVLSGTSMWEAQYRWRYHVQTGVADILLEDNVAPTITTDVPATWTTRATATATADDGGLGVKSLSFTNAATVPPPPETCAGTRSGGLCPTRRTTTGTFTEGITATSVRATDAAGNTSASQPQMRVDQESARFDEPQGALWTDRASPFHRPASVTLTARDGVPGGPNAERRSGVQRIEVWLRRPGETGEGTMQGEATQQGTSCQLDGTTYYDSCPLSRSYTFPADDPTYPSGTYTITFKAFDHAGNPAGTRNWDFEKDGRPHLQVEGGLRSSPVATGRTLTATAIDLEDGVRDVQVFVKPTGSLTPDSTDPVIGERVHLATCASDCRSASGFKTTYRLPDGYATGRYQITVRAFDTTSDYADERWVVEVVQLRSGDREKLGLEQWFELDQTDAGGEQSLYVNGETGNVIWHHVPIVNPGRGLSTAVNLTYNSHERGGVLGATLGRVPLVGSSAGDEAVLGEDLTGLAYREAGVGVSLGIGGPTRVNEALGGVLKARTIERQLASHDAPWPGQHTDDATETEVAMTDADGTQHVFRRRGTQTAWQPPPGVNLRLRYIGERKLPADVADDPPSLTLAQLHGDEAWELLRPDGVRHVFDSFGYLQYTEDRNGNRLTYVYGAVSAFTGRQCTDGELLGRLQGDVGFCVPQLQEVRQPTWNEADLAATPGDDRDRRIQLTYTPASGDLVDLVAALGLPAGTAMGATYATGGAPQVETITDAAGRRYKLHYDEWGFLTTLTENLLAPAQVDPETGAVERVTRLEYDEYGDGPRHCQPLVERPRCGDVPQLSHVVPVMGGPTRPPPRSSTPTPRRPTRCARRRRARRRRS